MQFEWDETKNAINSRTRGLSFATAALIFDGPVVEREDLRFPYGERRVVAIGKVDESCLTVIFTDRRIGDNVVRRIISARKSNRMERNQYGQAYPTNT